MTAGEQLREKQMIGEKNAEADNEIYGEMSKSTEGISSMTNCLKDFAKYSNRNFI